MNPKLNKKLTERKEAGILRKLNAYEGMIDLVSNDYLGLSEFSLNTESYKGATGSRLISGNSKTIEEYEKNLASFFNYEAGLFLNSGYDANLSIFASIPLKGDVVIYDEFIHASVRDGLRMGFADSFSFKHNSLDDLERLLRRHQEKTTYVVVEGLYSMHGDLAPLKEIATIVKHFGACLIVDEAHSGGILGKEGRGLSDELNVDASLFIKLITFGKAYGGHGALILCSAKVRQYLINFARPLIYSTALPTSEYERMWSVVHELAKNDALRAQLNENIAFFRSLLKNVSLRSDSRSPIQIFHFSSIESLRETENKLIQNNVACKAIYAPTVKKGYECLRLCVHSFNTREELTIAAQIITDINMHA